MSKSKIMTADTGKASEPAALAENDLEAVTGGGRVNHSEFRIVKLLDAATPVLAIA
jgi:type VI protein secretion system component Hcp